MDAEDDNKSKYWLSDFKVPVSSYARHASRVRPFARWHSQKALGYFTTTNQLRQLTSAMLFADTNISGGRWQGRLYNRGSSDTIRFDQPSAEHADGNPPRWRTPFPCPSIDERPM